METTGLLISTQVWIEWADLLMNVWQEISYKGLFEVVKLLLVLSHGQSNVERDFSINKEMEVENLKEHTIIAERLVCDHVRNVGGILNVELGKPLLLSVKLSRQRYERYLEDERRKKETQQELSKRSLC